MEEKDNKNKQEENSYEHIEPKYVPYINVGTKENPEWIPLF